MNYKYKLGEAVRVRDDLKYGKLYAMKSGPCPKENNNIVTLEMSKLHGQLVHIKGHCSGGQYFVEETHDFRWTDDMFEDVPVKSFICKPLL